MLKVPYRQCGQGDTQLAPEVVIFDDRPPLRCGRGVVFRVFAVQISAMLSAVNSPTGQCQQVRAARAINWNLAVMGRLVAQASIGQHQ